MEATEAEKKEMEENLRALAEGGSVAAIIIDGENDPKPVVDEWLKSVLPAGTKLVFRPADVVLCANPTCINTVGESKNPGVKKRYCSTRCQRRAANRAYYHRSRGEEREQPVLDKNQAQVFRLAPRTAEIAETRYRKHLERGFCPLRTAESQQRCPSRSDPYSKNHLCLIYAVLTDDMKESWAKERHEKYIRQFTTVDGTWITRETELADPVEVIAKGDRDERRQAGHAETKTEMSSS